jgi:hypothetical protein
MDAWFYALLLLHNKGVGFKHFDSAQITAGEVAVKRASTKKR